LKRRKDMARRRVAYRKQNQNKFAMVLVTLVLLMLIVVVNIRKSELKEKQAAYIARQEELQRKIEDEEARAEEIEEYEKYTQTQKYIEDMAKEKLGLVYEDEIVFKTEGE
jgi:cell division protein DivIC